MCVYELAKSTGIDALSMQVSCSPSSYFVQISQGSSQLFPTGFLWACLPARWAVLLRVAPRSLTLSIVFYDSFCWSSSAEIGVRDSKCSKIMVNKNDPHQLSPALQIAPGPQMPLRCSPDALDSSQIAYCMAPFSRLLLHESNSLMPPRPRFLFHGFVSIATPPRFGLHDCCPMAPHP